MGAWGTAISSNDTYADIYRDFFDLYNEGFDVQEISKKLADDSRETLHTPEDSNNFWFALAKAQWECRQLDSQLLFRIKNIIDSGADLEVWRQLGANEKDVKKRKAVLEKFLAEIEIESARAKPRRKKIIRQPAFEKGDCLVFKLEDGNYGGAVVLEAIKDSEYGYNLIATTRINQPTKPTRDDFESADVLVINHAGWDSVPAINWYFSERHRSIEHWSRELRASKFNSTTKQIRRATDL